MPDIAMCSGDGCPQKEQCYRFTAQPCERQSYFAKPPINDKGECKYFLPDPVNDLAEFDISLMLEQSVVSRKVRTPKEALQILKKATTRNKR